MARSKSIILMLLVILGFCGSAFAGQTIFVDVDATGANNGSSWEDAYNKFYDALDVAQDGDRIWVAQGAYVPDTDGLADPREATFQMKNGVTIEGGYAGFGEPDPDARNVELYETILSGDLADNDVDISDLADLLTEPTRGDNSYHIVTADTGINSTAVLDGFTITAGNADGGGLDYWGQVSIMPLPVRQ